MRIIYAVNRFVSRLAFVLFAGGVADAEPVLGQSGGADPRSTQAAVKKSPIQDNSFLIEEAYNQEPGVVQHISGFMLDRSTRAWTYAFTQEWPFFSQRHQLSYTLPVISSGRGRGAGVGDVSLNYRYQLTDGARSGVAVAPRLSLLVPSGDERRERGAGGMGVQVNLPISVEHSERLVSHWNAGASFTPTAKNAVGDEATTNAYNVGASAIWLPLPRLNFMLEVSWARAEVVTAQDQRVGEENFFLSPGVRGAFDFASGLQIVPGFAVPIGIGPSRGDHMIFLYLSFEHPF
ncbi:MAG: transporter [Gemmatimonadaceae bacterium]